MLKDRCSREDMIKISQLKGSGPAFPEMSQGLPGMSIRDYFACHAMQALTAFQGMDESDIAQTAVAIADATLAELVMTNPVDYKD